MPKYIVTTDDGNGPKRCDEPLEFPDERAASEDAQVALSEMVGEHLPDGKAARFHVEVRDEVGTPIYRASLSFQAKDKVDIECEEREAEEAARRIADALAGKVFRS